MIRVVRLLLVTFACIVLLPGSPAATGWGEPMKQGFNGGPMSVSELFMDMQGRGLAVWGQVEDPDVKVWSNAYEPGRRWGSPELLFEFPIVRFRGFDAAISPDGRGALVWTGSEGITIRRYTPGEGWSGPEIVAEYEAADIPMQQVALNSRGDMVVVWKQVSMGVHSLWSSFWTAETGWSAPKLIEHDDVKAVTEAVARINNRRHAVVVWRQGKRIWANRFRPASGWGEAEMISPDEGALYYRFDVVLDREGNALAVWQTDQFTEEDALWSNRFDAHSGWEGPVMLEPPTEDHVFSFVDGGDGKAFLAFRNKGEKPGRVWLRSFRPGTGWSAAALIHTWPEYISNIMLAADRVGGLTLLWEHNIDSRLFARHAPAGGTWGRVETITIAAGATLLPAMDGYGRIMASWTKLLERPHVATFMSSLFVPPGPVGGLTANGSAGPLTVGIGAPVILEAKLAAGAQRDMNIDLWLLARPPAGWPSEWYSWVPGKGWKPGIKPAYTGPCRSFSGIRQDDFFSNGPDVPGVYRFFLAVDLLPNGRLDAEQVSFDALTVGVVNP